MTFIFDDSNRFIELATLLFLFLNLLIILYKEFYKPKRDRNKLSEIQSLKNELKYYEAAKKILSYNYDNYVKKNNISTKLSIDFLRSITNKSYIDKFIEYIKQYNLCFDLFDSCRYVLRHHAKMSANSWIPNTENQYKISAMICEPNMILAYLSGNTLSANWLREEHNNAYHFILDNLHESEKEKQLDEFLDEISQVILEHNIIIRFRNEQKTLLKIYEELIKDLDNEIKKLSENLIN